MLQALRYALSPSVRIVVIGCDSIAQLADNAAFAGKRTPLSRFVFGPK